VGSKDGIVAAQRRRTSGQVAVAVAVNVHDHDHDHDA
jgi:hypothetical protein